uniref:Uncharacterized protein n=1 Tax=viral metagenome TaxID=1070528 RepID=A0A6M3MEC1_9ZZZZ
MEAIKIVNGKDGYYFRVNGTYISYRFDGDNTIKAITPGTGIPYGATQWLSVRDIRNFWNQYRRIIVVSTRYPYKSVWGHLEPVN